MTDQRLICPSCNIEYRISSSDIGAAGRQVRCVECQETWFVPGVKTAEPKSDMRASEADRLALLDNLENDQSSTPPPTVDKDKISAPEMTETRSRSFGQRATFTPQDNPQPHAPSAGVFSDAAPEHVPQADPEPVPPESLSDETVPLSPPPAPVGADVLIRDQADAARLAKRRRTIFVIWVIPLLLVIVAAILAYIYRQPIVNRVPQSATLYNAVGIQVKENGLLIDPPIAKTALQDGRTIITIEGHVRNISGRTQSVPLIEMTLHDGAGETLTQWYVEPARPTLDAREQLAFRTEYADPPNAVVGLRYRFVDRS